MSNEQLRSESKAIFKRTFDVTVPIYAGDKLLKNVTVRCTQYGNGPVPVFITVSGVYGKDFAETLNKKNAKDYTVYDIDPFFTLPPEEFQHSALTKAEIEQLQTPADLARGYEEIRKILGLDKIVLVGMSALGFVALEYYKNYPDSTLTSLMVGTPPYISPYLDLEYAANGKAAQTAIEAWKKTAPIDGVLFIFSKKENQWYACYAKGKNEFDQGSVKPGSSYAKALADVDNPKKMASFNKDTLRELLKKKTLFKDYIGLDLIAAQREFMEANYSSSMHDAIAAEHRVKIKADVESASEHVGEPGLTTEWSRAKWLRHTTEQPKFFEAYSKAAERKLSSEDLYQAELEGFNEQINVDPETPGQLHETWKPFNLVMRGHLFSKMVKEYRIEPFSPASKAEIKLGKRQDSVVSSAADKYENGRLVAVTGIADGIAPPDMLISYINRKCPGLQYHIVPDLAHRVNHSPLFMEAFIKYTGPYVHEVTPFLETQSSSHTTTGSTTPMPSSLDASAGSIGQPKAMQRSISDPVNKQRQLGITFYSPPSTPGARVRSGQSGTTRSQPSTPTATPSLHPKRMIATFGLEESFDLDSPTDSELSASSSRGVSRANSVTPIEASSTSRKNSGVGFDFSLKATVASVPEVEESAGEQETHSSSGMSGTVFGATGRK